MYMKHHSKVLIGVLCLFLVAVAAVGGYLFYNYQASQRELQQLKKQNPQSAAKQEIADIASKIGSLIELPKGEEPTLATVTDINRLKGQQFFEKAQNGDKVLIYTQSSKAILYRPQSNKIIEVASVNLGKNSNQATTPKLKIALYNGSMVTGATTTAEKTITDKVTNVEIVAKENAKKKDYVKTLVVDLSGKQAEAASQLAKLLGGSVGQLPTGESNPQNTDLVVILGK